MNDEIKVIRSFRFQLIRMVATLLLFLALGRPCMADDEIIGTFRGVPIGGDVVWENERVEEVSTELLWSRMSSAVYQAEIERLGIEVSDEELAAANEKISREVGFTVEVAAELATAMKARKEALTAWLASPEKDLDIYERILAPLGTSNAEWELLKEHYGTAEKVNKLRVPTGPEDILKAGIGGLREELLNKKLAKHVLNESVTSENVRWDAYLKSHNIEANSEEAQEARYFFDRTEVSLTLRDWVAHLIAEKQLVIENEKFKAPLEAHAGLIVAGGTPVAEAGLAEHATPDSERTLASRANVSPKNAEQDSLPISPTASGDSKVPSITDDTSVNQSIPINTDSRVRWGGLAIFGGIAATGVLLFLLRRGRKQ